MIAFVIVSHSPKVAEGVKDLAEEMVQDKVLIYAAGGVDENTIGTNAERILEALQQAVAGADDVLVFVDLGSAVMSARMAIEMLDEDQQSKVRLTTAPLVEGAIIGAVEASTGRTIDEVETAALATRQMEKLD